MIMLLMRKVVRLIIRVVALIMLLLLLLPGKLAYGQSTPEPTNTPYSPYNTPVPPGDPGNVCPAGTPLPTPLSMQYYDICGHCIDSSLDDWLITPIPFGTLLPYGTGTPGPGVVTATPAFTPTATLNPLLNNVYAWIEYGVGLSLNPWAYDYIYSWSDSGGSAYYGMKWNTNPDGISSGSSYTFNVSTVINAYSGIASSGYGNKKVQLVVYNGCYNQGNVEIEFVQGSLAGQSYTISGTEQYFTIYETAQDVIFSIFEQEVINVTVNGYCGSGADTHIQYQFLNHWQKTGRNFSISSEWNLGTFNSYPTPITDPGYCSVYDYQDDDTLVDYPGIIIRQGECIVIIPDFAINLPAIGENIPAVEWGIQGFSICPKWVDLGEIKVAEFEIPVDIVALPALVFIMWMIFVF